MATCLPAGRNNMGQKIHPRGFRIGTVFPWSSRWFAVGRSYRQLVFADAKLRQMLFIKLKPAGLAEVTIERSINKIKVTLHVSRPGIVIGRGGTGLEDLKKYIQKHVDTITLGPKGDGKIKVELAVEPVKEPNLSAYLVAQNIADQMVRRMMHKRVCNQAVERVISAGARGVRVILSGRIGGAEIARREKYQSGTIPLSTIREEVDFAAYPALTKSGYVGIKVWICKK